MSARRMFHMLGKHVSILGIPCGGTAVYSGGETFPTEQIVSLGTGTGNVVLNYQAFTVPDKFEVWFEGVKVIDTGYRGDSANQTALDNELISRGLPTELIAGVGMGSANFTKSTSTPTALVKIYGPLSGTVWEVKLECPV